MTRLRRLALAGCVAGGLAGVHGFVGVSAAAFGATQATVATDETTTSATYGNLTTSGPAVTVTVPASGKVKVTVYGILFDTSAGQYAAMSYAVSGANTAAASDAVGVLTGNGTTTQASYQHTVLYSGLTAGATTWTTKYAAYGGTAHFGNRSIMVEPVDDDTFTDSDPTTTSAGSGTCPAPSPAPTPAPTPTASPMCVTLTGVSLDGEAHVAQVEDAVVVIGCVLSFLLSALLFVSVRRR